MGVSLYVNNVINDVMSDVMYASHEAISLSCVPIHLVQGQVLSAVFVYIYMLTMIMNMMDNMHNI